MNKRLFFLKQDGWFETKLTGKMLQASHDELIRWAYAIMRKYNYRNYLVTENPGLIELQAVSYMWHSANGNRHMEHTLKLETECF